MSEAAIVLRPFILAGMHRSGTSFAASLLQSAGVGMGEKLYAADRGNVKGHFEDMDFVEVHRAALLGNGLDETGWSDRWPLEVPPEVAAQARALVQQKAARTVNGAAGEWGWKDPRTTLFLDFWHTLMPEARFIFLYREPWEVADSLFRRATDRAILDHPRLALDLWTHYNRRVLEFMRRHPRQCLLISNDAATADGGAFIRAINAHFGAGLAIPAKDLFDPEVMVKEKPGSWREAVVADLVPEALEVYGQLQSLAAMKGHDPAAAIDRRAAAGQLLPEWSNQRVSRVRIKELTAALDGLATKYGRTYAEVIGLRRQAVRQAALIGATLEMLARPQPPRGFADAIIGRWRSAPARTWDTAALRTVQTAADEEAAHPDTASAVRYVFAGPFDAGMYAARLRIEPPPAPAAAPDIRLALCDISGKEITGASAAPEADGWLSCKVHLNVAPEAPENAPGAHLGCLSMPPHLRIAEFHMQPA
ncbi:MAG TPA: sulfotransferase [Phycisphaerae bacterium]|nr:sulfotransferase [Phycisphaerae bacterium]